MWLATSHEKILGGGGHRGGVRNPGKKFTWFQTYYENTDRTNQHFEKSGRRGLIFDYIISLKLVIKSQEVFSLFETKVRGTDVFHESYWMFFNELPWDFYSPSRTSVVLKNFTIIFNEIPWQRKKLWLPLVMNAFFSNVLFVILGKLTCTDYKGMA